MQIYVKTNVNYEKESNLFISKLFSSKELEQTVSGAEDWILLGVRWVVLVLLEHQMFENRTTTE